jgi:hypothetical protein
VLDLEEAGFPAAGRGEAGPSLADVTTRSATGRSNSNSIGVSESAVMMGLLLVRTCIPRQW